MSMAVPPDDARQPIDTIPIVSCADPPHNKCHASRSTADSTCKNSVPPAGVDPESETLPAAADVLPAVAAAIGLGICIIRPVLGRAVRDPGIVQDGPGL